MSRPSPRTVLLAAAVLSVSLAVAVVVFMYAALSPTMQPRHVHVLVGLSPVLAPVALIQAAPFGSWLGRFLATVSIACLGAVVMVVVYWALGCGYFGDCL